MMICTGKIQRRITGEKKEGKDKIYHTLIIESGDGEEYRVLYEDSMIPNGRKGDGITLACQVRVNKSERGAFLNLFANAVIANEEIIDLSVYQVASDRVVEEW